MIVFKQKQYALDWWGRRQMRKANKKIAEAEKVVSNAQATRNSIQKAAQSRMKWTKRIGVGGLAAAGAYGAYKLYKHVQNNNQKTYSEKKKSKLDRVSDHLLRRKGIDPEKVKGKNRLETAKNVFLANARRNGVIGRLHLPGDNTAISNHLNMVHEHNAIHNMVVHNNFLDHMNTMNTLQMHHTPMMFSERKIRPDYSVHTGEDGSKWERYDFLGEDGNEIHQFYKNGELVKNTHTGLGKDLKTPKTWEKSPLKKF